ncbi:MAG: response regulator [Planctomycetota bacterium]|jgi:two-component system phosphate regulon response regulator PhoB
MAKEKILIVEDEEDILELIDYNLGREGYRTTGTMTGEEALELIKKQQFDLVILDLMLPDLNGLEVCRTLKGDSETRNLPIMMVTAKGEEADIVTGLEFGADDYLPKPFSPKVLVARVRALLRRIATPPAEEEAQLDFVDLEILPGRHEVRVKGKSVKLTLTEFRILHFLARKPGWVFSRYQIIDAVQGEDYVVTDRSVDVQIVGLRKKLGPAGRHIETVRGVGYRFKE